MARALYNPAFHNSAGLTGIVPVKLGGTAATTPDTAATTMEWIQRDELGVANGVAGLDPTAKISMVNMPDGIIENSISIYGPVSVYLNEAVVYTITDYDSFKSYTVNTTNGTVTRNADTVTYTPSSINDGGFTINNRTFGITILNAVVQTPEIISPSYNGANVSQYQTFESSSFQYRGTIQTQNQVRWEISATEDFAALTHFYEGTANFTTWTPTDPLVEATPYYIRVRHHSVLGGWSEWSAAVAFTVYEIQGWVGKIGGDEHIDTLRGVAISPDGTAIYAVGYYYSSDTDSDNAYITRWDALGNLIWQRSMNDVSKDWSYEYFEGVTVSPDGDTIYAVGHQSSSSPHDQAFITRWDANGILVWQSLIDGASDKYFDGIAISADGTAIYAVGRHFAEDGSRNNAYITRWNTSGNLVWQRSVDGGYQDYFRGVAIAPSGNAIYAVGRHNSPNNSNDFDAFITCWDASGNLMWQRVTGGGSYDCFEGVTVSPDGSAIYAAGQQWSQGSLNGDAYITRWDTGGNLVWQSSIEDGSENIFEGITVSPDGSSIYTVGHQYSPDASDTVTAHITRWNTDSTLVWQRVLHGGNSSYNHFLGVAISPNNTTIYAVGQQDSGDYDSYVSRIASTGDVTVGPLVGANMTDLSWDIATVSATARTLPVVTSTLTNNTTTLPVTTATLTVETPALTRYFSEY